MQSPLGSDRWNAVANRLVERCNHIFKQIGDDLTADGPPPLYQNVDSDRAEYENLVALRQSNSPVYWNDPNAVKRLQELTLRYGPPPAPGAGPFPFPQPGGAFNDPVSQRHA